MIKVAPSILSADFSDLRYEIERLDKSACDYIHIDVMDGHFVNNLTFGPPIIKSIRPFTKKVFDVHLMVANPEKYIEVYASSGADIIGIHDEITENKIEILQKIKSLGKRASITFNPDNNLSRLEDYMDVVDQVLIMSVFPGFGGQSFIRNSLTMGKQVKQTIEKSGRHIDLEIDGGVDLDNRNEIVAAGYNVLVSGSGIYKSSDFNKTIEAMKA